MNNLERYFFGAGVGMGLANGHYVLAPILALILVYLEFSGRRALSEGGER